MLQIGAMLGVVSTWCFLGFVFFGLGRLVCRIAKLGRDGWQHSHLSFWIGWATTIVVLQIWHLKFAVDSRALLGVSALGALGLTIEGKTLVGQARLWWRQTPPARVVRIAVVALLVVGFWSSLAIGPPHRPDTANYHMAAVRWNAAYPIVPGLGNLHGRLAFNNASFLYAAMLDVGPWSHKSHHLAHGLLAVVTILFFLSRVELALCTDRRKFPVYFVQAFCFPIAVLFTYKGTTSFQPDFITFLIGLIVSSLLFELLFDNSLRGSRMRLGALAVCFLSSVGLTVKLSFLPLGFLASVMVLGIIWKRTAARDRIRWSLIGACCLSAVLAIIPWMARGVILSGYVAFPSTLGALDAPWAMPLEDVRMMQDHIVGYARLHGPGYLETLDHWDWIGPVILRELGHPISVTIPLLCTLVSLVGIYRSRKRAIARSDLCATPWCFLIPSVAAVLLMIFTAPVPRFAGASIWVIAIGTMTLFLDQLDRSTAEFRRSLRLAQGLGIALLCLGLIKASRYTYGPSGESALAPTPVGEVTAMETASGLQVYIASEFAWDAPLPNSPDYRSDLSLIRDGDLGSGFKMEPTVEQIAGDAGRTIR
jgi:hypothetical protein